jgi:hypothetical protein
MIFRRRWVLDLEPTDLRYAMALVRGVRLLPKGEAHWERCDMAFVLRVCVAMGMKAVAKELEEALGTQINQGGHAEADQPPPSGTKNRD